MAVSKREALKTMMGQAKLMEIIDQAYDQAGNCPNCKALSEWWEKYGVEVPGAPGISIGSRGVKRGKTR